MAQEFQVQRLLAIVGQISDIGERQIFLIYMATD